MDAQFEDLLLYWPLKVIRDVDITTEAFHKASVRHSAVNRALKKRNLIKLRRGMYMIGKPFHKSLPSPFEISRSLYGPSYISFESALSYHQWIPEAVYVTTCATSKRSNEFKTPIGLFQYHHVPGYLSYLGVRRIGHKEDAFLIAEPWKAIADHFYVYKRGWKCLNDLYLDLRIEMEDMRTGDVELLKILSENYQCVRVRTLLKNLLKEILHGNKSNRRKNQRVPPCE